MVFLKITIKISGVFIIKYKRDFFSSDASGSTSEQSVTWQQDLYNQNVDKFSSSFNTTLPE